MKVKPVAMLVLAVVCGFALAGCAQDNTTTTDENPQMQKAIAAGASANSGSTANSGATQSTSTNTTRTTAKGGAGSGNSKLALSADPSGQLKYNTTSLSTKPGNVTIAFTNASPVTHDVAIKNASGKVLGTSKEISKGATTLKLSNLPAGTYTFFCTLPGHEQAGMKGTLTVK